LTLQIGRQITDNYTATGTLQLVLNKLVSFDLKITRDYGYCYRTVERKHKGVLFKHFQMHKHVYLLHFKKNASKYHLHIVVIIIIIIIITTTTTTTTSPQKWGLQIF
jgi:hypothetical protein